MSYSVAVVGATGNVGREMLNILAEREFPVDETGRAGSAANRWARNAASATRR
jgi:aspartate-semialdehyde dehydrogenase